MLEVISGSLFDSKEKYLCHQTNCVTNRAAHLSKDVFKHYPYADIYKGRNTPDKPGTIIIRGNGKDQRFIVNMLGQYYPGNPKFPDSTLDGKAIREKYFHRSLGAVARIENLESVSLPWRIGCGAAGGSWPVYLDLITRFADYIEKQQGAKVIIYKLPEAE